jgi:glycine dehydrogenase subunit 1
VPIVVADPHSLGVLEAPGSYGAQIVVGDGQPLGNELSFGGPSFGFMAADQSFIRRMPGRIVGETVDTNRARAYVLTLQTREQHIRREKATSNICTNQSLNALAGIVYLSWLGPRGLIELATLLFERAQLASERLAQVPGVALAFAGPSFKDVAIRTTLPAEEVVQKAKQLGVHPGFVAAREHPELGDDLLLVGITERRTPADIEHLASTLEEVLR